MIIKGRIELFCSVCKKRTSLIHGGEYAPGCFGACTKCHDKFITLLEIKNAQIAIKEAKKEIRKAVRFLRANGYKVSMKVQNV